VECKIFLNPYYNQVKQNLRMRLRHLLIISILSNANTCQIWKSLSGPLVLKLEQPSEAPAELYNHISRLQLADSVGLLGMVVLHV
jgi:hypothetical protein